MSDRIKLLTENVFEKHPYVLCYRHYISKDFEVDAR